MMNLLSILAPSINPVATVLQKRSFGLPVIYLAAGYKSISAASCQEVLEVLLPMELNAKPSP
jgi:hypothetical protein